jgi:hypothetical protein
MITRLRRGWTASEGADAYDRFLLTELFPQMRARGHGLFGRGHSLVLLVEK